MGLHRMDKTKVPKPFNTRHCTLVRGISIRSVARTHIYCKRVKTYYNRCIVMEINDCKGQPKTYSKSFESPGEYSTAKQYIIEKYIKEKDLSMGLYPAFKRKMPTYKQAVTMSEPK